MPTENQSRAQRIAEAAEQIRIKSELLRERLRGDEERADTSKDKGVSN
ncbi:MAG: hypothetical protein LPK26_17325 [Bacillaceae bacterium]|nr:hypothetical protein [Bacillaceae bacterium]